MPAGSPVPQINRGPHGSHAEKWFWLAAEKLDRGHVLELLRLGDLIVLSFIRPSQTDRNRLAIMNRPNADIGIRAFLPPKRTDDNVGWSVRLPNARQIFGQHTIHSSSHDGLSAVFDFRLGSGRRQRLNVVDEIAHFIGLKLRAARHRCALHAQNDTSIKLFTFTAALENAAREIARPDR